MLAYFLACLALASAAPPMFNGNFEHLPFPTPNGYESANPMQNFSEGMRKFTEDMNKLSEEMNKLSEEMSKLPQTIQVQSHFPTSTAAIQGNEYVVTINNLNGFDEKDIKLETEETAVKVLAAHEDGNINNRFKYDLVLPSNVNANGTWTFEMGVLKIRFPMNQSTNSL